MEENRSTFKLSGREKAGLIWHYLRPCWGHFAAALRSAEEPITPETDIYVADTIGEMGLWYALAKELKR